MPATEEPQADACCPLCGGPVVYEPYKWGLMRFHVLGNGTRNFLCQENRAYAPKETAS